MAIDITERQIAMLLTKQTFPEDQQYGLDKLEALNVDTRGWKVNKIPMFSGYVYVVEARAFLSDPAASKTLRDEIGEWEMFCEPSRFVFRWPRPSDGRIIEFVADTEYEAVCKAYLQITTQLT